MFRTKEQEGELQLAIRDVVGRNPLITMVQLQKALQERGYQTAQGNPLDWRYVSKLVRKLNREKALAVDQQKINERLAITKESYRLIIERLWMIIDWKPEYIEKGIWPPKNDDIVRAANTLIKLDLAILKAEMDAGIFDRKLGTVDLNLHRAVSLSPEVSTKIAEVFQHWGINLTLPERKAVTPQQPTDGTAQNGVEGVRAAP